MASEENKNTLQRTGCVDLDSILKQKEFLYGNTPAGVQVFKAIYNLKGIDQTVAAKVLTVDDLKQMKAKLDEVRFGDKLSHIPRIVIIHDVIPQESHTGEGYDLVIIQEFADAGSLEKEIRKRSRQKPQRFWSEGALMSFIYSCVETLAQLQQMQIAHSDIKPQNVLLFSNGDFKICDLGVSKQVDNTTMRLSDFAGTKDYFAYELKNAMQMGIQTEELVRFFKCDMVSLGLMVFNMARLCMTGQFNNHIDAMEKQQEEFQKMTYSETFKNILRRMLTLDPTKRPDFIQLLEELKEMNIEPVLLNSDWPDVAPAPSQRPVEPADENEVPTEVIDYIPGSSFVASNDGETVDSYVRQSPPPATSQTLVEPAEEDEGLIEVIDPIPQAKKQMLVKNLFGSITARPPAPPQNLVEPAEEVDVPTLEVDFMRKGSMVGSHDAKTVNIYAGISPPPAQDLVPGPPVHDILQGVPTNLTVGQRKVYITLAKTGKMVHSNPDGKCVCQPLGDGTNTVEERRHFTIIEVQSGWFHLYQNGINLYSNPKNYCEIACIGQSTNTDEDRRRFRMTEIEEGVYEFTRDNGNKLCKAAFSWLRCQKSAALGYRRFKITEVETDFEWFEISTVDSNETLYSGKKQSFSQKLASPNLINNDQRVGVAANSSDTNTDDLRRKFRIIRHEDETVSFALPNGQTMYAENSKEMATAYPGKYNNKNPDRSRFKMEEVESGIFEFVLEDGSTIFTTPTGWISVAQIGQSTNTADMRRRYTFRKV